MRATSLFKFGYLVMGTGIGLFASSYILAYEFRKPIGEIEEFISEDENDISNDSGSIPETEKGISGMDKFGSEKDISEGRDSANQRRAEGGTDGREEDHKEFSANQTEILDYYRSNERYSGKPKNSQRKEYSKRRKEFDKMREEGNANLTTRYSKMYNSVNDESSKDDREMTDILHEVSSHTDSQDSYSKYANDISDDYPSDDDYDQYSEVETDIHDQYNLERVEENIEIYLDDNPQDFVTLIFYEGDLTLCDDGEQIIPDKEDVVGEVALTRLIEGGPGAENGIIFVRNLKTCIDYEVVLDAGSYSETVTGQFESHLHNKQSCPIEGANGDGDH